MKRNTGFWSWSLFSEGVENEINGANGGSFGGDLTIRNRKHRIHISHIHQVSCEFKGFDDTLLVAISSTKWLAKIFAHKAAFQ